MESKYAGMSPYNYSFNNPVMFNDPSGMEGERTRSTTYTTEENGNSHVYTMYSDYHPIGAKNELKPINFTGDPLEGTEYPYDGMGSTGTVNYVTDITGKQYSTLQLRGSQQMYSWVNVDSGEAALFRMGNSNYNGQWVPYWTAEQAKASAGVKGANILAGGVSYGIMGGIAFIAFAAALPYLAIAGTASTSTATSASVASYSGGGSAALTMGGGGAIGAGGFSSGVTWTGIAEAAEGAYVLSSAALSAQEAAAAATKIAKAAEEATEKQGSQTRIALSVTEFLIPFAIEKNALTFADWPGGAPSESTPSAYSAAITTMGLTIPNISFHMNVSAKNGGYIFDPVNAASRPNSVTMAEFETVYRLFKNKTTFYEKSGSIFKEIKDIDKLLKKRGYKK